MGNGGPQSGPAANGKKQWIWVFEWVIVPMTGLILVVYGSLGGHVPNAFIPVIVGLIAFPFARKVDKYRKNGVNGVNGVK